VIYYDHVAKVGDEDFIKSIRDYKDEFREVGVGRMPLAKHEIAGTGKENCSLKRRAKFA
jgi:hypothetical protein